MNILWITNVVFPEAINILTGQSKQLSNSGGWLLGSANMLTQTENIKLIVVAPSSSVKKLVRIQGKKIIHYLLPCKNERKLYKSYRKKWLEIINNEKPHVVHIHGTEYAHGLSFLKLHLPIPTILSIQGLSSEIGIHYLDGISIKEIIKNTTLFDLLYAGTLFKRQRIFAQHGEGIEKEMIKNVKYVIGRTSFDKAHILSINPEIKYFKCNESLRDEFYNNNKWDITHCHRYSIFLSQSSYTIKGLQQVLKAMPYVLNQYPNANIRIAGNDIIKKKTLFEKIIYSTYAKYIKSLINQYNLQNKIKFLGPLTAYEMEQEYLRCNVFICPSSIENSPNSLAEAQILGVPCIASYVGGIPDMIPNYNCGILFRYSDPIMLASSICKVFSNSFKHNSIEEIEIAQNRHNRKNNLQTLLKIYQEICNEEI